MRIKQINFPAEILQAQRDSKLVIFAGAGVSVEAPSNLPDFVKLADLIGGGFNPRQEGEAIDRYLGRLDNLGVTVHEQVRSILSSPDSHPNPLHDSLVGIFKHPNDVRIVTTNFDRHFITILPKRFGATIPEVFCAPALPLGSNFSGIVHIHGSVEKAPNTLVLTDSDFGRAYITEGWATQFLQRLFSRYVILFVGYSHQDMLLNYLARGLTTGLPGQGRFVLTPPGDDARWNNLGIRPVHYPLSNPPHLTHSELDLALAAWAEQSQAGALAVEERISNIVAAGVPIEAEDRDFVEHALSEISTLRFFTRHANGLEWLDWIEGQNAFQRLFTVQPEYSDSDGVLAYWFAEHFICEHPDEALDLLRRRQLNLPWLLWKVIAHVLFQKKPGGAALSKWVPVLLTTAPQNLESDLLEYILSDCVYPQDQTPALLLLENLTKPAIHLKQSLRWFDAGGQTQPAIDIELKLPGSEHWLQQAWISFFSPHLEQFSRSLASMVTSHLMTAHRLFASFGRVNANWDPINFSRGMIESRQQDHLHNGISVLLDIGAAVMDWACSNDQPFADALIVQWSAAESLLLQRLAIHGVSKAGHIDAAEKLNWVLQRELLYRTGIKHEVFLLLQVAYPNAPPQSRATFLKQGLKGKEPERADEEFAEYEVFNLIAWLAKNAPSCELAAEHLARLKEQHPTYGEREHPDMDSWIGSVSGVVWRSPVKTDDLLSYKIDQIQEALANAPENSFGDGVSREGLLQSIEECARNSHLWGFTIAKQAQASSIWCKDIWHALIIAWGSTDLSHEDWETVLKILSNSPVVHSSAIYEITSLLERGIQSTSAAIPVQTIGLAKALADQMWTLSGQVDSEVTGPSVDWFAKAINHPAGYLTGFYLNALSKLNEQGKLNAQQFDEYKEIFIFTLDGQSLACQLARVLLAAQLHFLFYLDEEWTVQHICPLLDSTSNALTAKQCWQGYLYRGRWSDPMLVHLLNLYQSEFHIIEEESDEIIRSFCGHLSGIAIYSTVPPLENGWLLQFLQTVSAKTRAVWASQLRSVIRGMDEAAKRNLWERWLKTYWETRLKGIPIPLDPDESREMMEWALDLGPVFPEVVDLICASPYPHLGHSMIYYPIARSELLKQRPEAVAKLLAFLSNGEQRRPYDLDELENAVEQLIDLIPSYPALRPLCDDLVRLGVSGIARLVAKLT